MLCKRSTDLAISVFVELEDALRLCSVSKSLISKGLCKYSLSILWTLACLLTEKLRSVECKLSDLVNKLCSRSIVSEFLACLEGIESA